MRNTRLLAAAILLSGVAGVPNMAGAADEPNPKPPAALTPASPTTTTTTPVQPATPAATPAAPTGQTPTTPAPPAADAPKPDTAKGKSGSADDFLGGYHLAYALIYDKGDYIAGIAKLRALGYDDNADVATLIGYASRKLGRYDEAKRWYERALAADPDHAVTWSYYGMWHAEQGNLLKAKDDLEKVRAICGNTECREYVMLKNVIDGTATY